MIDEKLVMVTLKKAGFLYLSIRFLENVTRWTIDALSISRWLRQGTLSQGGKVSIAHF